MANLKAEFHEHLTRPRGVNYDEEMNICLLESHLNESVRSSPTPCWNSNRARCHVGIVTEPIARLV